MHRVCNLTMGLTILIIMLNALETGVKSNWTASTRNNLKEMDTS